MELLQERPLDGVGPVEREHVTFSVRGLEASKRPGEVGRQERVEGALRALRLAVDPRREGDDDGGGGAREEGAKTC